jgi:hypothetical protein
LPDARLLKVKGMAPGTGAAPSREKVYGGEPLADVIVILPLVAAAHAAAVVVVVAVRAAPAATVVVTKILHPLASLIVTVCAPAATLLKVKGLAPGTAGAPSRDHVKGGVPVFAVIVMVPLFAAGQLVGVLVIVPLTPVPLETVAVNTKEQL